MKHSPESSSPSPDSLDRDPNPPTGEESASPTATTAAATLTARLGSRTASNKGIALITVLTIVTLATILVLTFFTLARNEMVASVNYSDGLHAKHLSETAINMVIGQIRRATADTERVWACQPGAIRTYDGKSGQFDAGYKLYSSANMVEKSGGSGGESNLANDDYAKLATWSSELWRYADLNEPVIRGNRIYYPVVDPRARDFPKWDDAREFDNAGVEGFDWDTKGMAESPMQDALSQITDPLTNSAHQALPMPVEWIYQLEDGTLGRLDNSKTFVALGAGGTATKLNPIIGRIAFWADDESCKTNVNVHAGGASWDTPRAGGDIDRNLGRYQPTQHEWQRYPGHPATTSLAPVLFPGMKNITLSRDEMEKIFRLVPRIVGGGSASGTKAVNPNDPKEANGLIPDQDRLYPSLDDFILTPGGGRGYDHTSPKISFGTRDDNEFPRLDSKQEVDELLEVSRFFLTVSSRAPEVNLFNQPRVSIWPTYNATNAADRKYRLTPFDRAIRYCSSLGKDTSGNLHQYYFQRQNADHITYDWDRIPRNQALFKYLDRLTSRKVPGYGASFDDKYGKENRIQLLTMIFDFIRSSNLFDDTVYDYASPNNPTSWKAAYRLDNSAQHLTYTNFRTSSERGLHMGYGQVAPIHIAYDGTIGKGMGRFYSVDEVALQLICCAEGARTDTPTASDYPLPQTLGVAKNQRTDPESSGGGTPVYSNLPPMHPEFQPASATDLDKENPQAPAAKIATWPVWYKRLYDDARSDPPSDSAVTSKNLALYANEARNWNWLLAYNSKKYRELIAEFKYEKKYSRDWITRDMNEDPIDASDPNSAMRLAPNEKMVQAVFLIELYCPSAGWVPLNPDMKIEIDTSNITFETTNKAPLAPRTVGFDKAYQHPYDKTGTSQHTWVANRLDFSAVHGGRNNGGGADFRSLMRSTVQRSNVNGGVKLDERQYTGDPGGFLRVYDQGVSGGKVESNGETVWFRSWDYGRRAWFDRSALASAPLDPSSSDYSGGPIDASNLYPTISMPFRTSSDVVLAGGAAGASNVELRLFANRGIERALIGDQSDKSVYKADTETHISAPQPEVEGDKAKPQLVQTVRVHMELGAMPAPFLVDGTVQKRDEFKNIFDPATSPMRWWSASFDGPNHLSAPAGRMASSYYSLGGHPLNDGNARLGQYIREGDTVWGYSAPHGDQRVTAAKLELGTNDAQRFRAHPDAGGSLRLAHSLTTSTGGRVYPSADNGEGAKNNYAANYKADEITPLNYPANRQPLPLGEKMREKVQLFGDFDNGMGGNIDGAFINKVDEGNTHSLRKRTVDQSAGSWEWRRDYGSYPYFVRDWTHEPSGPSFFSPNRMMPSPIVFGSLPSEILVPVSDAGNDGAWQTLLFRPNVVGNGYTSHPGAVSPPDHMLLDLFWMPVVEPYVVSEPSSTAGRVNMNYQILPFKNITRTAALRGVFQSEYMLCIPNYHVVNYKTGVGRGRRYHWLYAPFDGELQRLSLRSVIVEDKTLEQFEDKFDKNEIFLTSSEICDIHLIPQDIGEKQGFQNKTGTFTPTLGQMENGLYWSKHMLVGDNSREAPYSHIYPRLTTKSNTFQVHVRSQVLKKARETTPDIWNEQLDTVVAEYRGSAIVERYVEARDPQIPDYVKEPSAPTLDQFYKFRVVNEKRFSP